MAKRKQSPSLSPDQIRMAGLGAIIVLGLALTVMGVGSFLRTSPVFKIREVVIAPNIQPLEFNDLQKLKGQDIFSVDLAKIESRVHAKYPQLADLRVMRRLPDQIFVSALKRDPYAMVVVDTRTFVVDRNAFIIGPPHQDHAPMVLVRGVKYQKPVSGDRLQDGALRQAFEIIDLFSHDTRLASASLKSVNVKDLTRIVCALELESGAFDVIVDKENIPSRLKMLADVLSRGGLDLALVKYMDLRFGEPVIGQKKVRK